MAYDKGGISTAKGRGKRIDLRMAQIDKYSKDPSLELVGFYFRDKKTKSAASAPARKPKTNMANKVPGAGSKPRTSGGSIPTPARNQKPLSAFTGRTPRALDTATKITPPKQPAPRDYSSPRAKRNMAIAETALSTVAPFGIGKFAKAAKAVSEVPKYSKYTKALLANKAGQITAREAAEQMGMPFAGRGNPRAAANAKRAVKAYRDKLVTGEEAVDMLHGYRKGGLAGGSIPTPARNQKPLSAFTGRTPRALDTATKITPPKQPAPRDYSSPRVKRNRMIAEAALSAVGVGKGLKMGKAALEFGIDKALMSAAKKNLLTQRGMSNTLARTRPGEVVPPYSTIKPRFQTDRARSPKGMPPKLSDEAKEALRKGLISKNEARMMAEGFALGGLAKRKRSK